MVVSALLPEVSFAGTVPHFLLEFVDVAFLHNACGAQPSCWLLNLANTKSRTCKPK
jgi:hypothetical protein